MRSTPGSPGHPPACPCTPRSRHRIGAATLVFLVLAGPGPARAALAPEARPVVDRYVEALGGRKALRQVRSLYERATVQAFGLKGSAEFWIQRPDRVATRVSIGPFTVADGADGPNAWRIDPGGKLLVLDGKDLDDARANAWFGNERWLEPDQGGGTVRLEGKESDSTGRYAVLEVAPPAGRARRLYFDEQTGLLARSVSKRDQNTVVTTLSDYRKVGPLLQPWRTFVHVAELPANDLTVTLDSVAVNVEIPRDRFAPPGGDAAAPVRWLGTPGTARIPAEYSSRHVWLRAAVNGAPPADFIFDTGASLTVLDSAYAASIGVRTEGRQQGHGAGSTGGASFARLDSLRVTAPGDGVVLRDLKIGVLSLNPFLAPYFWRDVAGVLGFDFISRFVTEIDYDEGRITLRDSKTFRYAGKGESVPMTLAGSIPVVEMKLDDRWTGTFRLDVGSGSTLDLHTPFVNRHGMLALEGPSIAVQGGGFGGTFETTVRRMKRLTLGKFTVKEPLVGLAQTQSGGFASEDYAGNLGNRFLDRFRVTLDYERKTLWLEPGKRFDEREVFPRCGVQLVRQDGAVRAGLVLAGSPADEAGVRVGDVVTGIDGAPIEQWNAERAAEVLERGEPGSRHTLEVRREGAPLTLSITLRELL